MQAVRPSWITTTKQTNHCSLPQRVSRLQSSSPEGPTLSVTHPPITRHTHYGVSPHRPTAQCYRITVAHETRTESNFHLRQRNPTSSQHLHVKQCKHRKHSDELIKRRRRYSLICLTDVLNKARVCHNVEQDIFLDQSKFEHPLTFIQKKKGRDFKHKGKVLTA